MPFGAPPWCPTCPPALLVRSFQHASSVPYVTVRRKSTAGRALGTRTPPQYIFAHFREWLDADKGVAACELCRTSDRCDTTADAGSDTEQPIVPIPYILPEVVYTRNSGEFAIWLDQDPPFAHSGRHGKGGRLAAHRLGVAYIPNRFGRYHLNIWRDTLAEMKPVFEGAAAELDLKGALDAGIPILDFYAEALGWAETAADLAAKPPKVPEREKLIAGPAKDIAKAGGLCLPFTDLVAAHVVACDIPFFDRFKYLMDCFVILEFEAPGGSRRRLAAHVSFTDSNNQPMFDVSSLRGSAKYSDKPPQRQAWAEAVAAGFMNARAVADLVAVQAVLAAEPGSRDLPPAQIAEKVLARLGAAGEQFLALPSNVVPNALAGFVTQASAHR